MQTRNALLLLPVAVLLVSSCSHVRMGMFVLEDNPTQNDPASIPRGKAAFEANCAPCHGADADGRGPQAAKLAVAPTNFRAPTYTKSAKRIAAHIAYGKGEAMPAFVDKLPEDTIWDIGNYLRSLQKPGNATP